MDYLNFDLQILRDGNGYRANVFDSPYGQASAKFVLPVDAQEIEALPFGVVRQRGPANLPDTGSSPNFQQFGEALYTTVFAGDVGVCWQLSQQEAKRQGRGLRVRLHLDKGAPELAAVPWEVLQAKIGETFHPLAIMMPMVRYLSIMGPASSIRIKRPLHILAVTPSPRNVPPLGVEKEWERLQEATVGLQNRVIVERLPHATLGQLNTRIRQGNVHVLHFVGHGSYDSAASYGALFFENHAGDAAVVSARILSDLLKDTALRVVFLNACESAHAGFDNPLSGVAQQLVSSGIPIVIAMRSLISDQAAVTLAHAFYQAVAENYPVDAALTKARHEVFVNCNDEGQSEWALPVLFGRLSDYAFFDPPEMSVEGLPDVPSPYRGLQAFEEVHAPNYFGRDSMRAELLNKLAQSNFVALTGPSGSGKSSLLRAGLIPALQTGKCLAGSAEWEPEIVVAGDDPIISLLLKLIGRSDRSLSQMENLAQARELSRQLAQGDVLPDDLWNGSQRASRLLLIVDQLEEVLLSPNKVSRDQFLTVLLAAGKQSWVTVVVAFRADVFGKALEHAEFGKRVAAGLVSMTAMDKEELRAAIEKPALNTGRRFEADLVERILETVSREPGQLPLLEFALAKLWERQTPDGLLTLGAYKEVGEVDGAVANHAENVLRAIEQSEQENVRAIFTRLVRVGQPNEGTQDGKRRIFLSEIGRASLPLVQRLVNARLLVTDWDKASQAQTIEIAHEALIRKWTTLQKWLESDREFKLWQDQIDVKVREWSEKNQESELLLRGSVLDRAEEWWDQRRSDLSKPEHDFIQASVAERERVNQERQAEAQRRQQLAYEQEQNAYQRQLILGALGAALGYGIAFAISYRTRTAIYLPSDPLELLASFLLFSPLGFAIGVAIGLSLGRWRTQHLLSTRQLLLQKMLAVGASGAIAGGLTYFFFALMTTLLVSRQLEPVPVLRIALSGVFQGAGLGLGVAFTERPRQRLASATAFSLGAAVLAVAVQPTNSPIIITAILTGGPIGFFAGLGFVLGARRPHLGIEEGSHESQTV